MPLAGGAAVRALALGPGKERSRPESSAAIASGSEAGSDGKAWGSVRASIDHGDSAAGQVRCGHLDRGLDDALDAMVEVLREYAEDWQDHLRAAPNHRDNRGLVQLVGICDDESPAPVS